jgi:hypothetical protein
MKGENDEGRKEGRKREGRKEQYRIAMVVVMVVMMRKEDPEISRMKIGKVKKEGQGSKEYHNGDDKWPFLHLSVLLSCCPSFFFPSSLLSPLSAFSPSFLPSFLPSSFMGWW